MIFLQCNITKSFAYVNFCTGNISHIFPLMWRFLPGMDPQVDSLFVRDLDSDISKREQEALQEFSRSSKVLKMYPKITENNFSNLMIFNGIPIKYNDNS